VVEVAWQDFQRGQRADLQQPVACQQVFYTAAGIAISQRLPGEFLRALQEVEHKQSANCSGDASFTRLKP